MSFEQNRGALSVEIPRASTEQFRENDTPDAQRPVSGSMPPPLPQQSAADPETRERLDNVLHSDIGIVTLLARLKQSIGSTKDFAAFLKKRSSLEEEHAQGLRKLARSTYELLSRPETRQGSFVQNYGEVVRIHERMSDHGIQFSREVYQMSDELHELAGNMDRDRKHWKQSGMTAEKRAHDTSDAMDKAKSKYDSVAEQYDRARTGDRQSSKFGIKGPKSAAQQEEDLHRKAQTADADYASKVQMAKEKRQELVGVLRPEAVKALQELIAECDSALSAHMQRFAYLNERLILAYGLCVNPLKGPAGGPGHELKSLREVAQAIDNEKDFQYYILSFSDKATTTKPEDIRYEKHPALTSPKHAQQPPPQFPPQQSFNTPQPQLGNVHQATTVYGGPYDQSQRPAQPGQVSGVVPFQSANRDGSQMGGQMGSLPAQYPPHPPQSFYNSSQIPQLPKLEPLSLGGSTGGGLDSNYRTETVSPIGPNTDYRSAPSSQNQVRPGAPPPGGSNIDYRQGNAPQMLNKSGFQAPQAGTSGEYRPINPPLEQTNPLSQHPPLGSKPNFPPSGSASNLSSQQAGDRGPSLGQNINYQADGRAPPLGSAPNLGNQQGDGRGLPPGPNTAYQGDGRGLPPGPSGAFRGDGRGLPPGPGAAFRGDGRGLLPGPNAGYQGDGRGLPPGPNTAYQGDGRGLPPAPNAAYQGDGRGLPPGPSAGYQGNGRAPQQGPNVGYRPQVGHPGPSSSISSSVSSPLDTQPRRPDIPQQAFPPPNKPVFGVSLDELFRRDQSPVPAIVYQCVQAVDMFGLDVEGLYRTSGSAPHIEEMKAMFDHDSSQVDFHNPANFFNDIPAVTTLLKHFLRDLPDPLLTRANYSSFIQAAKFDDDNTRRDSLHAIVNGLPDPNYATLRVLVLHLSRVASHSAKNRMTPTNLAICFGPTLMGQQHGQGGGGSTMGDSGWQARVVETILLNTHHIFDDDE